jgi:glycosyltransferase involved in cell wall biosynthesis
LHSAEPLISVVIPERQEERGIRACVEAVLAQDCGEPFEVIVVDGMSTDRTREILEEIAQGDPRLRVLDNPGRIVPTAMNIGIRAARGKYIVRVDGHSRIPADYLAEVLRAFEESGAECVGGAMVAEGRGFWGRLIALATSSSFGMGGSRFHERGAAREMDTVYLGAYPRQMLLELGLYDERFVRNQDDELNFRLRAVGGKVWFSPRIWVAYECRSTLGKLFSQYAQYGWWKVQVYRKHPRMLQLRHLVPSVFVLGVLITLGVAPWFGGAAWWLPVAAIGSYLGAASAAALATGAGIARVPALVLTFLLIHVAYGTGMLAGLPFVFRKLPQ